MKNKLIKTLIITFILLFSYMNICYGVTVNEELTNLNVYIESACFMGAAIIVIIFIKVLSVKEMYPKRENEFEAEYFREIPNKKDSPYQVAMLVEGLFNEVDGILGNILDMCRKGWINFEINGKKNTEIILILNEKGKELTKDEELLLEFLKKINPEKNTFTVKELEKYGTKNSYKFKSSVVDKMNEHTLEANKKCGYIDFQRKKVVNKIILLVVLSSLIASAAVICHMFYIPVSLIAIGCVIASYVVCLITGISIISNVGVKTDKGFEIACYWQNFKKTCKDFSNVKNLPDFVLWEEYITYACAFAKANRIIKQLKVRCSELQTGTYKKDKLKFLDKLFSEESDGEFIFVIRDAFEIIRLNYSAD